MFDSDFIAAFPKRLGFSVACLMGAALPMLSVSSFANQPPVWQTKALPPANEGGFMNARLLAQDESKDLSFALRDGPQWVQVTERGIMTYRPDYEAAGQHAVTLVVNDGEHEVPITLEIIVRHVNQKPTLNNKPKPSVQEGELWQFSPDVQDLDGQTVSLALENAPQGMKVTGRTIEWQVDYHSEGSHQFNLILDDGEGKASMPIKLDVEQVNQKPSWKGFKLPKSQEAQALRIKLKAVDIDNDPLSYTLLKGPEGALIEGNVLVWQPGYQSAGSHAVEIVAQDAEGSATYKGTWKITNTNRLPELATLDLPSAKEGEAFSTKLLATDPDGEQVAFSLSSELHNLKLSESGVLSFQPDYDQSGTYSLDVNLNDGKGSTTQSIALIIENTNRAPVATTLSLPNAKESEAYEVSLPFEDPDADSLVYTLVSAPEGVQLVGDKLLWQPDFDSAGDYEIRVSVSDGELTTESTLSLTAENTNREPEILSEPIKAAEEDSAYLYQPVLDDLDGDELTLKLVKGPKGMRLEGEQLTWTPGFEQAGSVDVELQAFETRNPKAAASQRFVIEVANTNRLPVFAGVVVPKAKENKPFTLQLKAVDPDKQRVSFAADVPPEGLTISESGLVQWTPSYEQSGNYELTVSAHDGEAVVSTIINLDVENTNRKPTILSKPELTLSEGELYEYAMQTEDLDGDNLTFSLVKKPQGASIQEGILGWAPTYEQAGLHPIVMSVSDGESTVEQAFSLKVANTNRAPSWTEPEMEATQLKENKPWGLTLKATDPDRDTVRFSLQTPVDGLKLQGNKLSWKPDFTQAGEHEIVLEATDGSLAEIQTLVLGVENTNRSPRIISKGVVKAAEDQPYRYDLGVVDADEEDQGNLMIELVQGPEGMTVLDHTLSWVPDFESAGSHQVVIKVTDGDLSAEQSYSIKVANTNRAPVFESEPVMYSDENSQYLYEVIASDPDGQPSRLTLVNAPQGFSFDGKTLSFDADFNSAGDYAIVLRATDGQLSTDQAFTVSINNVNRLPVFVSEPSTYGYESLDYRYTLDATDEDGEHLRFTLINGPQGLSLDANELKWRPGFEQSGYYDVIVAVSDGIDTVQQSFFLEVENTNREPEFVAVPDQQIRVKKNWLQPLVAQDADGEPVSFKLIHAPMGMVINEENALVWKPAALDAGKHTVILAATDGDLKVRQHFDLNVITK